MGLQGTRISHPPEKCGGEYPATPNGWRRDALRKLPGGALVIPYIHIDALKVGPLSLQPFGLLVAVGVLVGVKLATMRARRVGMDPGQLHSFISWILLAGFVGGHVLDSIFYHPTEVLEHPWTLLELWNGLSSFGGFLGAMAGAIAWKYYEMREVRRFGPFRFLRPVRREKPMSVMPVADLILSVFPVAWIFGRAGCAIVHDHPGARATMAPWLAVAYGPGPVSHFGLVDVVYGMTPRYDLGLLEMLFAILLAAAFALTWRRSHVSGWYVAAASVAYAPVRFALDFLRLDDGSGGDLRYAGLTPAQWACVALLLFGVAIALRWRRGLVDVSL